MPVRRQFEEDVWLRLVRIDGRANRPKIGTRQHRPDPALAGDPQGRRMGRAAADEKPGCDQAKHTPTAIRHELTITTSGTAPLAAPVFGNVTRRGALTILSLWVSVPFSVGSTDGPESSTDGLAV